LTTAALLARSAAPVHAYVLPPARPVEEQAAAASLIYVGTVTSEFVEPPLDPNVPDTLLHKIRVSVRVDRYLKGSGSSSFAYDTSEGYQSGFTVSSSCPFRPAVGTQLLVLANQEGVMTEAAIPLDSAGGQDMLRQLNAILSAGKNQVPDTLPELGGPPSVPAKHYEADFVLTLALLMVSIGVVLVVWRRRKEAP
jgi:hypothetical protein